MKIYHLNCGTIHVIGGVAMIGTGGLFTPAEGVIHCVLAETDDGLLLIDTGLGTRDYAAPTFMNGMFVRMAGLPRDPAETAIAQVGALGYDPADVRHIVLTHFHFDHVGGLPDFPQAKVHIYAGEYAGVMHPRDMVERFVFRPEHHAHGPDWQVHDLADHSWFGFDATPPVNLGNTEFRLVPLPGHTKGHCGVALRADNGWLFHCGDAYTYHGTVDPQNPTHPPYYRLFKPYWALSYAFRAIGKYGARLRDLRLRHGDEITLTCSHDPVELAKFTG
jgi:glyoxylase-like metal-dependent hydrolase (beta-lactamase superfamily II)